jgi:outer membrane receptor protein involved in Fe transport
MGPVLFAIMSGVAGAPAAPPPRDDSTIVVTGERVKRSLRETASSVSVVTQRDIEAASADRVKQMLQLVPNVQLGNGSQGPAIRGQDTTGALQALPAFLGGNRPRTTLIVDGRRTTYNEFVFGSAPSWDLNRIEVFRSPQTTTQGQNSIAGAIFVYSNDPTFEPETKARLIAGNYHTGEISALASGPLSGDLALRVSGDLRYSHTTSRIADRIAGGDPNHDVYGLARAKLLVKPHALPGAQLTLTYSHLQSQAPQVVQVTAPFRSRRDQGGFYGTFRINVDSLTAAARHESGALTTTVVLTAGDSLARRLAFPGLGQARIRGRDWSAEAVVNWAPDGPFRSVAGISHAHVALRQFIDLSLIGALGRFHDAQDGTGIFGEINATILPKTTLTAGIRYQQDRQDRSGALTTPTASIPLDFDRTFHAWLPKLSVAYDFSGAVRAGVMVQRAYNPGGTTLRFDIARPDDFKAETLWDYELFARARLGRGMTASLNAFYYDMRNAQRAKEIIVLAPAGFPVGFVDLFNVPKARSYGLEGEIDWRASKRFSSRLALGLLDTRIVKSGSGYTEFEGNQFARSPHLSAAAAVYWEPAGRVRISANVRHHSSYFSDDGNGAGTLVPPATIADARAEYRLHRIILSAYLRNLFDNFAYIERDATTAVLEDPREIGVGIETRF